MTLGGIDLNNSGRLAYCLNVNLFLMIMRIVINRCIMFLSGSVLLTSYDFGLFFSVVVKADKKLLTVLFPDGRDGRAFTLKVFFSKLLFSVVFLLQLYPHTGNPSVGPPSNFVLLI